MSGIYIKSFFLLNLLLALPTQADVFKRYSAALRKSEQARGVFHYKMGDGQSCTGFFIGPNGQALTSLHCVESCLVETGSVKSEPFGPLTKNTVSIAPAKAVLCPAEFAQGKKPESTSIRVLHVFGPGFLSPRDQLIDFFQKSPEAYTQLLEEGFEGRGDLALIQLPMKSSCLRVAPVDFSKVGKIPIFNLAYPIAYRSLSQGPVSETLFTNGNTLLFTKGEATQDSQFFQNAMDPVDLDFVLKHMPRGTFLTSQDVEGGSSGSPIFGSDGTVIGATRMTFNPSSTEYRAWMAEGVDLFGHLDEISRWVPENGNCLPSASELK